MGGAVTNNNNKKKKNAPGAAAAGAAAGAAAPGAAAPGAAAPGAAAPGAVAVSAIEAEFVCPLCQYPAENAVQLKSCGHFFCQTCCEDLVSRRFTECVAAGCRVPFRRLDIMPSHTTRNILDMCNHFKL